MKRNEHCKPMSTCRLTVVPNAGNFQSEYEHYLSNKQKSRAGLFSHTKRQSGRN